MRVSIQGRGMFVLVLLSLLCALGNASQRLPLGYTSNFSAAGIQDVPPPSKPPQLPTTGAAITGKYRNLFVEYGYDEKDVGDKLKSIVQQLFYGDPNDESVHYESKDGSGSYVLDVADKDVRTEGMSYGMMVAVQLDNRTLFDSLWKWAQTHMWHTNKSDPAYGYFAWHASIDGHMLDPNPASDGETWFVTALYSAAARWNEESYRDAANEILDASAAKTGLIQSVYPMWNNHTGVDGAEAQVVFVPYANSRTFTDPSYQIPGFYELWRMHNNASQRGSTAALAESLRDSSRYFLLKLCPGETGLCSDYTTFDGKPTGSGNTFAFDAFRVAQNVGMDYHWFAADKDEVEFCNKLLNFFTSKSTPQKPYGNHYNIDSGQQLSGDHSPGLVAMNAACALASDQMVAWDFVAELWRTPIPTGNYRYYDGMLYLLGWLQAAGKFRLYI